MLVLGTVVLGCSSSVPVVSPASPAIGQQEVSQQVQAITLGQVLPVGATVKIANQMIQLEVAKTEVQQSMGLMYRKELAANHGMVFPFKTPRITGFWMKNCLINLDMLFLRNGKVVEIAHNVPPCKVEPCAVYGARVPVDQVIELRGGRAIELGVKVGDRLLVQYQ
jgi:uncharacterized membrane protein (UPF0127 family)